MIRALVLLFLLGPVAAQARAVTVQSGGHAGFSRLVLSPGPDLAWSFGRTDDGYELRLRPRGTAFDVSRVYDLIGRDRLAAIWTDPGTGALRLRVGCACHAMPYELGDGILVIDLRDGPAPDGSSFETSLLGSRMPPLVDPVRHRPRSRPVIAPYDWLANRDRSGSRSSVPPALAERDGDTGLRQGLMRQMADGAARGVVTMTLPARKPAGTGVAMPMPQMRVGEDLGLIVLPGGQSDEPRDRLTPDGVACIPDDALDLDAWLVHPDPAAGLALVRGGLVGEFDTPEPAALATAVRYLIAIGFGAEARQLIDAFAPLPAADTPEDATLLQALTYGVDGEATPAPRFGAMAGCDTAAALWAAIETTGEPLPAGLNDDAVIRAFSALPPGLRRHLGGDLTARLLAVGRTATARALTDAMQRLPGDDDATRLGAARVGIAMGEDVAADGTLHSMAQGNGPIAADALVELATARAISSTAMTSAQVDILAALAQEYRGTAREPGLRRAGALAMALTDDFDGAFAAVSVAAPVSAPVMPNLWRLLAERGSDAAVLTHAVLADPGAASAASTEVRHRIAERLVALGLPDAALPWLPAVAVPEADRLSIATLHLARRDGLSALRAVEGLQGRDVELIRAQAEAGLGAPDRAALAYARSGNAEAALMQTRLAGDWTAVARDEDAVWAAAARLVTDKMSGPEPEADIVAALTEPAGAAAPKRNGPLAQGRALLAESVAGRATIEALLVAVPAPDTMISAKAVANP